MKFRGERPLYDEHGNARDRSAMSDEEVVDAILCWSAMPGASRHHWGTELDLVDAAAMPEGYRVQLAPHEAAHGGVFHTLHCWLDANMARFGFFRPYRSFRGGVLPEPWHVSYAPVAGDALERLTPELLTEAVAQSDMLGKDIVVRKLADIYRRYVANVDQPVMRGSTAIG
jgi:LAS superfamily LD-carboxypeptidase LdcB